MKKKKRSFLLIGMGSFGHLLCRALVEEDCEVMVVDRVAERVEDVLELAVAARVGDCTNLQLLESFDIPAFDGCFVCMGEDFQNSLEITSFLKELGAKRVMSKAETEVQAKFLLRNGADQIIYPEGDAALRTALSVSSDQLFDYTELAGEHAVFELQVRPEWVGQSIAQLSFRSRYQVAILAVRREGSLLPLPEAGFRFVQGDHIVALGHRADVRKLR